MLTPQQIAAAFQGQIRPPRVRPLYLLAQGMVCMVMIILPVIYFSLIAGIGYLLYLHIAYDTGVFSMVSGVRGRNAGRAGVLAAFLYIAPIAAGLIAILFMLKPLIAPRIKGVEPFTLQRHIHPTIYAYVESLCRHMGSPIPTRIDINEEVNASASFREGFIGMLKGDLVLTIGAPLVNGLELRTLTGVLAHEFGHFTQRIGMRQRWIIGMINGWLARAAYERDAWDAYLYAFTHSDIHWLVNIFAGFCRVLIWASRLALKVLLHVAHALSCYLARQMEYDADAWQCRITGSGSMPDMVEQISELGAASVGITSSLSDRWRERRMPDNLPALIASYAAEFDQNMRKRVKEQTAKAHTSLFDTHPTWEKRLKAGSKLAEPGIFKLEGPAVSLFQDFSIVGRQVTFNYYQSMLGDEVHKVELIPTNTVIRLRETANSDFDGARQFFLDDRLLGATRLELEASLPEAPAGEQARAAAKSLRESRQKMLDLTAQAIAAAESASKHWEQELLTHRARAALQAGVALEPVEIKAGLGKGQDLVGRCREMARASNLAPLELQSFREAAETRIVSALQILQVKGVEQKLPTAADELASARKMLPVIHEMGRARLYIRKISREVAGAERLLERLQKDQKNERIVKELFESCKRIQPELRDLRGALSALEYPFPHATGELSLGAYVVAYVPQDHREVIETIQSAGDSRERFWQCYSRAIGPLLSTVLKIEKAMGLSTMVVPAPKAGPRTSTPVG